MERLQRLFGAAAAGHQPGMDTPTVDNAEMVYISSLALLKVGNQISCHKISGFCVVITGLENTIHHANNFHFLYLLFDRC